MYIKSGHMTKMAIMSIYSKSICETKGTVTPKLINAYASLTIPLLSKS